MVCGGVCSGAVVCVRVCGGMCEGMWWYVVVCAVVLWCV